MVTDRDGLCLDACVGETVVVTCLANPSCIGPIIAGIGATAGWIYGVCMAPPRNERDTGLSDKSDDEVSAGARDKSLSGEERRRYQKEEKAREIRNRQKRTEQKRK
jgi:hypothetical protein